MAISFFNKASQGGGDGSSLNLFVQTTEPSIKKGIWLQANKTPEHYIYDEEVFVGGEWLDDGIKTNLPYATQYNNSYGATVGTNAYIFLDKTHVYKYNSITDTYTKLSNVPFSTNYGTCVAVGTDIYLLGSGYDDKNYNYKYDTLTDTYTQMTNIPYTFERCPAISVGTDIYLFWSAPGISYTIVFKYDTLTDTYTQLSGSTTFSVYDRACVTAIGSNVYCFWCENNSTNSKLYKYDTLNNSWIQLSSYNQYLNSTRAVTVGTDIYLFGSVNGTKKYALKYNTLTDTYTALNSLNYDFYARPVTAIGNYIFLFGSSSSGNYDKLQTYALESKTYQQDESVIINQGKYKSVGYEIELYDNSKNVNAPKYSFADAWYYTQSDGLITNIPTYYGDGTQWNKLKN